MNMSAILVALVSMREPNFHDSATAVVSEVKIQHGNMILIMEMDLGSMRFRLIHAYFMFAYVPQRLESHHSKEFNNLPKRLIIRDIRKYCEAKTFPSLCIPTNWYKLSTNRNLA